MRTVRPGSSDVGVCQGLELLKTSGLERQEQPEDGRGRPRLPRHERVEGRGRVTPLRIGGIAENHGPARLRPVHVVSPWVSQPMARAEDSLGEAGTLHLHLRLVLKRLQSRPRRRRVSVGL